MIVIRDTVTVSSFIPPHVRQVAVVSDPTVAPLIADKIAKALGAPLFLVPKGEAAKCREVKTSLEDALFAKGFGRECCLVAVGGGALCDLVGFVAATFCRGVPLILVPTTLLAMVDAAIGGKNGLNTPYGKNAIGTFWPPAAVLIGLEALSFLPEKELQNGMAEVIKHACIADATHFEELERGMELHELVEKSGHIKQKIVEKDPQEKSGLRRILNFGHTVAHALECFSGFQMEHGRAVAAGMIIEAQLSHQIAGLPKEELNRIEELIWRHFPDLSLPSCGPLFELMTRDKKTMEGRPRTVLLEAIGRPAPFNGAYCCPISLADLHQATKPAEEQLALRRAHSLQQSSTPSFPPL